MDSFRDYFEISESSASGLIWKQDKGRAKAGTAAGSRKSRYWDLKFNGKMYKVHRVVAFLSGTLSEESFRDPSSLIDHIDGNGHNNNVCNLRAYTYRENSANTFYHRSGHLIGTSFEKRAGKWRSRIQVNGKDVSLGYYDTQLEASIAYLKYVAEVL